MPALCPSLRFLAPALLLAILALPALSRTATGQELTPATTNTTPTANATNATEWVMPPEVEKLFPKDAVFDEGYWNSFFRDPLTACGEKSSQRAHRKFKWGTYNGVCKDYHLNLELWGGEFYCGCMIAPIHPKHPHKELFSEMHWGNLNARGYVSVFREYYLAIWKMNPGAHPNDPECFWREISPVIIKMLQQNGMLLQRAEIDVDNDGNKEIVYRFAFVNASRCMAPDKSILYRWKYCIIDDCAIKDAFNIRLANSLYTFFIYNNKTYFAGSGSVGVLRVYISSNGAIKATLSPVCGLDTY